MASSSELETTNESSVAPSSDMNATTTASTTKTDSNDDSTTTTNTNTETNTEETTNMILPTTTTEQQQQQDENKMNNKKNKKRIKIVFIHLDLGIGGAEQLILQLAIASQDLGYDVDIVTTRCDQDHCFQAVKKAEHGRLANDVYIYGRWIPPNIPLLGGMSALCSTLRMLYLTWKVVTSSSPSNSNSSKNHSNADIVVVDVLPTALPLLLWKMPHAGILFYCHFPDKLLIQTNTNNNNNNNNNTNIGMIGMYRYLKQWYRKCMDQLEERTMGLADTLVVNSKFTKTQVQATFPSLASALPVSKKKVSNNQQQQQQQQDDNDKDNDNNDMEDTMQVLYPALDTSQMTQPNQQPKIKGVSPIVSLNRFERKKNIELLIKAYAYLVEQQQQQQQKQQQEDHSASQPLLQLPPVIIAGGYDKQNVENVEYRGELQQLVNQYPPLEQYIEFRMDITDEERSKLFQTALCVVYTPDREHFGIVPLESMYAGTPVLAVNTGGPTETVLDGITGFLRDPTPQAFGDALQVWINDPHQATIMGRAGRNHVESTFGTERLQTQWKYLIEQETLIKPKKKQRSNHHHQHEQFVLWSNTLLYFTEAILAILSCLVITWILRFLGILKPNQSILGALRNGLGDEL